MKRHADQSAGEPGIDALVIAARSGNRDAFASLYERYAGYVYSVLLARMPPHDAPDLVQDVFLQAFERLPGLREPGAFAGWLATIARNRATDFLRQRHVTEELHDSPAPSDSPDARLDAERAIRAIRELPEAYRETLLLRLVQGLTGPEIAALTGLTPDSVRVNLHRGFRLLREHLGLST